MSTRGRRGIVIDAGARDDTGTALIDGWEEEIVSLRRAPLACGDLVRVVVEGRTRHVVDVIGRGAVIPLLIRPQRRRTALIARSASRLASRSAMERRLS